ncbi:hypothetical protein MADA3029_350048 [Vibrio nigripulchritudo MADA3029]|nr:hypothetical protein VIBNIMADA3020_680048 [Vibrio nigripulchritudo MADA3020]CCN56206.1 hypothetical protein VIBNIMADA3021_90049 [Vibrio nigripulchritudo MADA3021]CCN59140.1 hypothetical protein MADA3029_350048 [Vibrio nigripulchritudo MADA3029]
MNGYCDVFNETLRITNWLEAKPEQDFLDGLEFLPILIRICALANVSSENANFLSQSLSLNVRRK